MKTILIGSLIGIFFVGCALPLNYQITKSNETTPTFKKEIKTGVIVYAKPICEFASEIGEEGQKLTIYLPYLDEENNPKKNVMDFISKRGCFKTTDTVNLIYIDDKLVTLSVKD